MYYIIIVINIILLLLLVYLSNKGSKDITPRPLYYDPGTNTLWLMGEDLPAYHVDWSKDKIFNLALDGTILSIYTENENGMLEIDNIIGEE